MSRRVNILHVYKTASPISFGGVEDVIRNIANTTDSCFNHTVLCTNKDKDFISNEKDYKLISYKYSINFSNNPISLRFHWHLFKHSNEYDLIHFHVPYPMMDFHYLIKVPYIITYHADLFRSKFITMPYRLLAKRFLKHAKYVIYTSKNYATFSTFSKYVSQQHIIPLTTSKLTETYLDKELPCKDYFIYIGAFRTYKDLPTLLDAVFEADVDLILLGNNASENELQRIVGKSKFPKVSVLGNVSEKDKLRLLSKARALILPSKNESEAFGVVLLEAAALGKPLITADLKSGVTEVNVKGVTGEVFEKSNVYQLAEILKKFKSDDKLCDRLGFQNQKRYKELYTRKLFGEKYTKLYFNAIK